MVNMVMYFFYLCDPFALTLVLYGAPQILICGESGGNGRTLYRAPADFNLWDEEEV